jgi:hypothetical protein
MLVLVEFETSNLCNFNFHCNLNFYLFFFEIGVLLIKRSAPVVLPNKIAQIFKQSRH